MLSFLRTSMARLGLHGTPRSALSLFGTLGSRGIAALGGVVFSFVIAQIGGAVALGSVAQITSCLVIAALIIRFGTDQSLLRLSANLDILGRGRDALPYLLSALTGGLFIAVICSSAVLLFTDESNSSHYTASLTNILILSLPGLTVGQISSACLKGFRYSTMSVFAELGAISGIAAIFILLTSSPDLETVCWVFVFVSNVSAVLAAIVAIVIVLIRPLRTASSDSDRYHPPTIREFLIRSWPFMITGLSILATQSGSFAIGGWELSEGQLGELRTAERLALLIGFSMTAIAPFMAPRIAAAWTMEGVAGARKSYRQTVLTSLIFAIPATVAVAALGPILLYSFGPEFASAYPLLLIMALGQLAYAGLSPLNVLLQTTGHEHQAMLISVITLVVGAITLWLGSVVLGTMGFALAYTLTIILRGLLAYRVAHRYILN